MSIFPVGIFWTFVHHCNTQGLNITEAVHLNLHLGGQNTKHKVYFCERVEEMLSTCVDNVVLDVGLIFFDLNWLFTFILCCFRVWNIKVRALGEL